MDCLVGLWKESETQLLFNLGQLVDRNAINPMTGDEQMPIRKNVKPLQGHCWGVWRKHTGFCNKSAPCAAMAWNSSVRPNPASGAM